ncbi:MAG: hypothetical protein Q9M75_00665, partial [Ghiorsea sp.]|nr:hypothetical protein [Ghiorsea sp.]
SGIQLNKTTSTPNIGPGGVARYTITVTNNGGTALLNATISDILPTGFTYKLGSTLINGAASTDPAGTLATPQWLLTSVAANSSLTISFNVDVDPLITPKIYYNTIQGHNVSGQTFPNPGPTAPVTIVPPTPALLVLKSANAATAAPGATIVYTVNVVNTGTGQANTVVVTDAMSQYTKLALTPFAPANTTMFSFVDGANPSGLLGTATISFSNDGGATYNYIPVVDGTGHDPAITNFKLQMNGTMNANKAANPSFSVQYQVQVK